jgi:hypothetical protein
VHVMQHPTNRSNPLTRSLTPHARAVLLWTAAGSAP